MQAPDARETVEVIVALLRERSFPSRARFRSSTTTRRRTALPASWWGFAQGNVARALFVLSAEQRKAAMLASLANYFGSAALKATAYHELVWATEAFTLGAYGSFSPPGVLTSPLAPAVKGPAGNVYFAGADYSPFWPGYMEGAIKSGGAVAEEVIAAL